MEATAFNYFYVLGYAVGPLRAGGNVYVTGGATANGIAPVPRRGGGTFEVDGGATRANVAPPASFILHSGAEFFTRSGAGTPLATRLIQGCGERSVPWGVLQEITEVDESDVQIWTATAGPYAGRTAGVSLNNPRVSASLVAIFLIGTDPPRRGSFFQYRRDNGDLLRMICLKITKRWQNEAFLALQIEGTAWDSPLARQG